MRAQRVTPQWRFLRDATIFLTHDWGTDENGRQNHDRVKKIYNALRDYDMKPWFDSDQMTGDITMQMTNGIDKSAALSSSSRSAVLEKAGGNGPIKSGTTARLSSITPSTSPKSTYRALANHNVHLICDRVTEFIDSCVCQEIRRDGTGVAEITRSGQDLWALALMLKAVRGLGLGDESAFDRTSSTS